MAIKTRTSGIMIPAYVATAPSGYTGPGDIATTANWKAWYSPARAFKVDLVTPAIQIKYSNNDLATFSTKADGTVDYTGYDPASHGGGTPTVNILYDQTGNGVHLDILVGAVSFVVNSISGSLPGLLFAGTQLLKSTTTFVQALPLAYSIVAKSTNSTVAGEMFMSASAVDCQCGHGLAAQEVWLCYAGGAASDQNTAGALSDYHAGNFYIKGGTGNNSYVDGTSSPGTADIGTAFYNPDAIVLGNNGAGSVGLTGTIIEAGLYGGDITTFLAGLDNNQRTFYGLP